MVTHYIPLHVYQLSYYLCYYVNDLTLKYFILIIQ